MYNDTKMIGKFDRKSLPREEPFNQRCKADGCKRWIPYARLIAPRTAYYCSVACAARMSTKRAREKREAERLRKKEQASRSK